MDKRLLFSVDVSRPYDTQRFTLKSEVFDDFTQIGTGISQISSTMVIETGEGNDTVIFGHIQGAQGLTSSIFGGAGNDILQNVATFGNVGMWGNGRFRIDAGSGCVRIELARIQVNF